MAPESPACMGSPSNTLAPLELASNLRSSAAHFEELEQERDRFREKGLYKEAGEAQAKLENAKVEEEMRRLRALADKHQMELAALEECNNLEYEKFAQEWEQRLAALTSNISEQQNLLHLRHQEMQDQFEALCRREVVKPKWSRDLLNMRVQEEHLIKQRNFKVAAKLKKAADEMEAKEYQAARMTQQSRHAMEAAKLQARRVREAEALQKKLQLSYDEHVLQQERELDKLMKRCAASRLALLRNQANKMFLLEQALKGWFNPKKFGLSPPPLNPPPVILSPGAKLALERSSRPNTGQTTISRPALSAPGTPSPVGSPCADHVNRKAGQRSRLSSPGGTKRSLPNVQAQHRSSLMPKGSPMVATVPTYHHPLLPKEPQPNGALPILFSH